MGQSLGGTLTHGIRPTRCELAAAEYLAYKPPISVTDVLFPRRIGWQSSSAAAGMYVKPLGQPMRHSIVEVNR